MFSEIKKSELSVYIDSSDRKTVKKKLDELEKLVVQGTRKPTRKTGSDDDVDTD